MQKDQASQSGSPGTPEVLEARKIREIEHSLVRRSILRGNERQVDNMISFDIEGQAEALEGVMDVPPKYFIGSFQETEIEANTRKILELLAAMGQTATFFILGRIARDMPDLVRLIAQQGHEIACHGLYHRRLYLVGRNEVTALIRKAKQYLEDASHTAVRGFRAPQFSILDNNRWVLDVLQDLGFVYDSSIYPTSLHDAYGIGAFSTKPRRLSNGLIEVPLSVTQFLGQRIPFGGGGYLRIYPLALTKRLFTRLNRDASPGVIYLHPYEVGDMVHRIEEMPARTRLRRYLGRSTVRPRLAELVRLFRFVPIGKYLDDHPL